MVVTGDFELLELRIGASPVQCFTAVSAHIFRDDNGELELMDFLRYLEPPAFQNVYVDVRAPKDFAVRVILRRMLTGSMGAHVTYKIWQLEHCATRVQNAPQLDIEIEMTPKWGMLSCQGIVVAVRRDGDYTTDIVSSITLQLDSNEPLSLPAWTCAVTKPLARHLPRRDCYYVPTNECIGFGRVARTSLRLRFLGGALEGASRVEIDVLQIATNLIRSELHMMGVCYC